jgi:UDP-2-acetamido-3-amino-2,3-dideoxy-glucuronate N-acetyltransferase
MDYTAHPTAIIRQGARNGQGTRIRHWVHVGAGADIGSGSGCPPGQNVR